MLGEQQAARQRAHLDQQQWRVQWQPPVLRLQAWLLLRGTP
jgi:hypothetical protein